MSDVNRSERLFGDARERLETVPTLVDLVQHMNVDLVLRDADNERFNTLEYDAIPIVRACRELAGLSWNGLCEYLSTDARAIRLGFDPKKFGKYNTAPTRQTLTTARDEELSDGAKRSILAVSERLVDAAYEHEKALTLRSPQHVEEHESDLRERHVSEYSNDQIRQKIHLARDTIFGAFDSGRAENATYPESRFDELQGLMWLFGCGTPAGQSRMTNFFGNEYTPHGDTHLRTVQKYSVKAIQTGFDQSIENLLAAVNHLQILQPPRHGRH